MMPNTVVVLDACVLIPMPLADTLLRLAEVPRLYRPKWSGAILAAHSVADANRGISRWVSIQQPSRRRYLRSSRLTIEISDR